MCLSHALRGGLRYFCAFQCAARRIWCGRYRLPLITPRTGMLITPSMTTRPGKPRPGRSISIKSSQRSAASNRSSVAVDMPSAARVAFGSIHRE